MAAALPLRCYHNFFHSNNRFKILTLDSIVSSENSLEKKRNENLELEGKIAREAFVGETNYQGGMPVLESVMKFDLAIGTTR